MWSRRTGSASFKKVEVKEVGCKRLERMADVVFSGIGTSAVVFQQARMEHEYEELLIRK